MKVDQKGHTTIIKDRQNNVVALVGKITNEYHVFQGQNLILDISHNKMVSNNDLIHFKELAKNHKKAKKSFVVVAEGIDFNAVPAQLTVVPSVLEAHDVIEMEEIERDLGF
jgi:phosphoenolpyruvate-protein kinase (PTS system EI component)